MAVVRRDFTVPEVYTYDPTDVVKTNAQIQERVQNRNDFIIDCRFEFPGLDDLINRIYLDRHCNSNTKFWCLHGPLTPHTFRYGKVCIDTHPPLSLEDRLKYFSTVPLKNLHVITFENLESLTDFYNNNFRHMRSVTIWTIPSLLEGFTQNSWWNPSNMYVKDISNLSLYWSGTDPSWKKSFVGSIDPMDITLETTKSEEHEPTLESIQKAKGLFSWWSGQ